MQRTKKAKTDIIIAEEVVEDSLVLRPPRWIRYAAIGGGAALALSRLSGIAHAADLNTGVGHPGVSLGYSDGLDAAMVPLDDHQVEISDRGSPKTPKTPKNVKVHQGGGDNHNGNHGKSASNGHEAAAQSGNDHQKDADKIGICHATGSATNPFVFIRVDEHAVKAHQHHQGMRDVIGVDSEADCPAVQGASGAQQNPSVSPKSANSPNSISVSNSATGHSGKTVHRQINLAVSPQSVNSPNTVSPNTVSVSVSQGHQPPAGQQGLQQGVSGAVGQQQDQSLPQAGVGGVMGQLTPEQAQQAAEMLGGGITPQDVMAMTQEELANAARAGGIEPEQLGVAGEIGFAPTELPMALPNAGGVPVPVDALIGLGALLAGAGALFRRMRQ